MNQVPNGNSTFEEFMISCNSRFDGLGKELENLSNDVRTVLEWISIHFGTELACSRQRTNPQRIEIEIITTPAPPASSNNTSNNNSEVIETGSNNCERNDEYVSSDEAESINSPANNNDVDPLELDEESLDNNNRNQGGAEQVQRAQVLVAKRRPENPASPPVIEINDEVVIERGSSITGNNNLLQDEVPKRGRPCKQLSQNRNIIEPQRSQCDQCGKILKDAGSLRQHKTTHKDLRPHVCPECGKAFRRKFHLKTHSLIHSGEKKHQCGYCGKLFLLPKDLVAHERIHTGERPYACHICQKAFNLNSHLKMHVRIHTGEKPYKCEICDKAFSQSNSLRVHKKVHFKVRNHHSASSNNNSAPASMRDRPSLQILVGGLPGQQQMSTSSQPAPTPQQLVAVPISQGQPSTSRGSNSRSSVSVPSIEPPQLQGPRIVRVPLKLDKLSTSTDPS